MTNNSYISGSQVVHQRFPYAFYNQRNAVVQVRYIRNTVELPNPRLVRHVRQQIADRMSGDLEVRNTHMSEAQRRRQQRQEAENQHIGEEDDFLDDLFGDELIDLADEDNIGFPDRIRPEQLEFVLVDSNASVRTRIFPRSFHCSRCGHYIILDPNNLPRSLKCPCCQSGDLRQESIIFGCARCASIQELVPPGERIENDGRVYRRTRRIEDLVGNRPECPDCQQGHIHLEKHETNLIQQWEWVCTSCSFHENVEAVCFRCMLPRTSQDRTDIVRMRPFPATASGSLIPLIDIQTFIGNDPIEPSILHQVAQRESESWADYFEMETEENNRFRSSIPWLKDACIRNAYLLKRMSVVTTAYGYRAGNVMQSQINPVQQDDQLSTFFRDPEGISDFLCYGMIVEGAALAIEFDRDKVYNRLLHMYQWADDLNSYEDAVMYERNSISTTPLYNMVQSDTSLDLIVFPALHAVEHALLAMANRLVGNDLLGSMLFFRHGIILLYEREEVGRGGVVQLVNKGIGLVDLIEAATDHVMGCAQGCQDSCPSCTYVQDMFCHPLAQETGRNWLPPNALLSRNGARLILSSEN